MFNYAWEQEFSPILQTARVGDECKRMDIKIDVRKRETPVAYVIDRTLEFECFNRSKGKHDMGNLKEIVL